MNKMTYYHASPVKDLKVLRPGISMHGKSWVYLTDKRENTLVYLCNAIEKYCKETDFAYEGRCYKWASYGFDQDGILQLEEYYPNAIWDTYKGMTGYIYSAKGCEDVDPLGDIAGAFTSDKSVEIDACEIVPDAYEAIMEAVLEGKLVIQKYEDMSATKLEWIKNKIMEDYNTKKDIPEYIHFLEGKFSFLSK